MKIWKANQIEKNENKPVDVGYTQIELQTMFDVKPKEVKMKIKKYDYMFMKTEIEKLVNKKGIDAVLGHKEWLKTDHRVKNLDKRFRWDLFNASALAPYTCDVIYKYANDDHIDTALKKIVTELNLM